MVAIFHRHFVGAHEGRRRYQSVRPRPVRGSPAASSARTSSVSRSRSWLRRSSCRSASISSSRRACGVGEVVFGGRARGAHGAEDAAAFGGDFGVGGPGQAAAQFVAPVAGKHDVRVRIDEAGDDGATVGVDDDCIWRQLHLLLEEALQPR